jgi:hypothetical protein
VFPFAFPPAAVAPLVLVAVPPVAMLEEPPPLWVTRVLSGFSR